jgi:hypothetical protein
MRAYPVFADSRLGGECIYCGGPPETREHVPPRVFLDKPYPDNLFVVDSCASCNASYALDEEYLACLIEVVRCGTTDPAKLSRESISATLRRQPALAARIEASVESLDGRFAVRPEHGRVERVLEKIARGLAVFENAEAVRDADAVVRYWPFHELEPEALERFLELPAPTVLPEVGSRMLSRVLLTDGVVTNEWQLVQPGRFSYAIEILDRGTRVKMIVGDLIAAEVDIHFH